MRFGSEDIANLAYHRRMRHLPCLPYGQCTSYWNNRLNLSVHVAEVLSESGFILNHSFCGIPLIPIRLGGWLVSVSFVRDVFNLF